MNRTHIGARSYLRAALLGGAAAIVVAGGAHAQAPAQDQQRLEEIIVTGSRIARTNLSSPTPLNVVTEAEIRFTGYTNLADVVQAAPQVAPNLNNQSSGGFLFVGGQSRVDLRGLGSNRTLVLVDGRRHVAGALDSPAVDLNTIPTSMVARTEIITGGASAVYGSEAVAGVVNVILRKDLDGAEFDAHYGISQEGDGQEYGGSATFGGRFGNDRGYVMAGVEYTRVRPVFVTDRDWAFPGITFNTLNTPATVVPTPRSLTGVAGVFRTLVPITAAPAGGLAANAPGAGVMIDPNTREVRGIAPTCTGPRNAPTSARPLCDDPGLDYAGKYTTLQGENDRLIGRAYASYDLFENVRAIAEIAAASVNSSNPRAQPAFSGGASFRHLVRRDNAYLNGTGANATLLRQYFDANGLTTPASTAELYRFTTEFGERVIQQERDMIRAVAALEGDFNLGDRSIRWDAYYQYGELNGTSYNNGQFFTQRHLWQLDAVRDTATGNIVCRALLPDAQGGNATLRAAAAGCVPWDFLNGPSQAAIDYAKATSVTSGYAKQRVAAVNATTSVFELPAGDIGLAVGAEYREEESLQTPDSSTQQGLLFTNAIPQRGGQYDVAEYYAELRVPLLADMPFAKELTIDGAYRYADYSTVGGVSQWKVGGEYAPVEDLRFRATYSESVRAPNIIELFAPQGENFTTAQQDPCDRAQVAGLTGGARTARVANCTAAIPGYDPATFNSNIGTGRSSLRLLQGGNPNLQEETAETLTVGAIIQPRWVDRLAITVDYFKIDIKDAVALPQLSAVFSGCYDSGLQSQCALITRDPTGARTSVIGGVDAVATTQANIASYNTEGVDFSIAYGFDINSVTGSNADQGDLSLTLQGTYMIRSDFLGQEGIRPREFAGTLGTPRWKLSGNASYSIDKLTVSWQTRFESSVVADESLLPLNNGVLPRVPFYTGDYWIHDIRFLYDLTENVTLRFGALNVTNEKPPMHPSAFLGTGQLSGGYDNRGRYFYSGVNVKF